MGKIICEECGNSGSMELVMYNGKTLNNLKKHEIFVGGKRYFKAFYWAVRKDLEYMPSYADFDPNCKEHQIIYARALRESGMIGELGKTRIWSEPCFRCSPKAVPLSLSIIPVILPGTL
jgi:hypothetical protein